MTRELAFDGMRIGLLGGSFNPAHDGHRHISLVALRRLALDRIWWLVSPQNPLKQAAELDDYGNRFESARAASAHPRIFVSDFERRHRLIYTIDTIRELRRRYRGVRFVWLMGADNLAGFHRWRSWREIAQRIPIAVFARPGSEIRAPFSPAARRLARWRLDETDAKLLAETPPPGWIYLTETLHPASSTAIRRARIECASAARAREA
ncbi:MAG: nicotinate-nucleotide adenylyltransferase [Parvularculaceae bacterium]